MAAYAASTAKGELVVTVGDLGEPLRVTLSPAAVAVGDDELTTRIVALSALTYMWRQCAEQAAFAPESARDHKLARWKARVAAYAASLDF